MQKVLTLGEIEGRKRRGQQRMRWWGDIINSMDMNWSKFRIVKTRKPGMLQFIGSLYIRHD